MIQRTRHYPKFYANVGGIMQNLPMAIQTGYWEDLQSCNLKGRKFKVRRSWWVWPFVAGSCRSRTSSVCLLIGILLLPNAEERRTTVSSCGPFVFTLVNHWNSIRIYRLRIGWKDWVFIRLLKYAWWIRLHRRIYTSWCSMNVFYPPFSSLMAICIASVKTGLYQP